MMKRALWASSCALLLGLTTSSANEFSYWDDVRASAATRVLGDSDGSLFVITTPMPLQTVRLAELKLFLPLSVDGKEWRPGAMEDVLTALVAQTHWNEQGYKEENGCNLRLTMDFLDTQLSPIETTKAFTSLQQQEPSLAKPAPTAIVGAVQSAVTAPLALLSGLNHIPQISYSSTSSDFDVKGLFPTFGRTVTNSAGEAAVALEYFKSVRSTHVAVLYFADSFGSALQKAFSEIASESGIEVPLFTIPAQFGEEEAASVMKQLQEAGYRHIYAIVYEQNLDILMPAADAFNLISKDHLWFFAGMDIETLLRSSGSSGRDLSPAVAKGLDGAVILSMQAAVTLDTLHVGQHDVDQSLTYIDEDPAHASFRQMWSQKRQDEGFIDYVRRKTHLLTGLTIESNMDSLNVAVQPLFTRPFLYDAVTSLALAMCRSGGNNATSLFTGTQIYEHFRILNQEGASGRILIDEVSGTRDYKTINFVLWNGRATGNPDQPVALVPTRWYKNGVWEPIGNKAFLYHGGGTAHPTALPQVEEDLNVISSSTRAIGFLLMGITAGSCAIFLLWMIWYWDSRLVLSMNRSFLLQILGGSIVMVATAFPLSRDETTTGEQGLDVSCKLSPWLYVMGVSLVVGGLLAKALAIRRACLDPQVESVSLTGRLLLKTTAGLALTNASILIIWNLCDPLEWTRTFKSSRDRFDRLSQSYASCESEHDAAFLGILCSLNLLVVIVTGVILFQSTAIELEHHESRYLGFAVAAFFQAWCMGAPILAVVHDNPEGRFLVQMGIVFVTAQATVFLIFLPRVRASVVSRANMRKES